MLAKLIGQKYLSIGKACDNIGFLGSRTGQFHDVTPINAVVWIKDMKGSHAGCMGGVGGIAVIHFTDWRLILDYVPYINGKFKTD